MTYLILAYPTFAAVDLAWIEAIRAIHDPQVALVAPHITLVFAMAEHALGEEALLRHLHDVVAMIPPLALMLRCTLVMPETGRPGGRLFLIADEGMSQLVKAHDLLYSGLLASHLRLDIPFVPHITLGAGDNLAALYAVAQELNATEFALAARVDRFTLVRHTTGAVTTVDEVTLTGPLTNQVN